METVHSQSPPVMPTAPLPALPGDGDLSLPTPSDLNPNTSTADPDDSPESRDLDTPAPAANTLATTTNSPYFMSPPPPNTSETTSIDLIPIPSYPEPTSDMTLPPDGHITSITTSAVAETKIPRGLIVAAILPGFLVATGFLVSLAFYLRWRRRKALRSKFKFSNNHRQGMKTSIELRSEGKTTSNTTGNTTGNPAGHLRRLGFNRNLPGFHEEMGGYTIYNRI